MLWQIVLLLIAGIIIWLVAITIFFIKISSHYNHLIQNSPQGTLQSVLEKILQQAEQTTKDIDELNKRCDTIEKEGNFHIQKIGLLRFNPFKDTGGDQSFILALLDGRETGVVISGLYARSGTRWYAKKIVNGQGIEYGLSEDEKKAIKEAKRI